jgi:CheY-like chemotaxis protein
VAPEAGKSTITIAILGADPVVENVLALLLGSAGYSTKVIEEPSASAANAEEQLQDVDLLLLTASLREEAREGFLKAIEATPAPVVGIPVLTLSTAPQDELNDLTGMVPWPTPLEDLMRAIEAALVSAPGSIQRLPSTPAGYGGDAAREECA